MALSDLVWRRGKQERAFNVAKNGNCPRQSLLLKTAIYADHSIKQKASSGACLKVDLSVVSVEVCGDQPCRHTYGLCRPSGSMSNHSTLQLKQHVAHNRTTMSVAISWACLPDRNR